MQVAKAIVFETNGRLEIIRPNTAMYRAAVVQMRETKPASVDGSGMAVPAKTELVVETPAETLDALITRLKSELVPAGANVAVVDASTIPNAPVAHLAVDWATGTITVSPVKALVAAKVEAVGFVRRRAAQLRADLAGTSDPIQIAAWANKATIARRFAAGIAIPAEVASLVTEAQMRGKGETPQQLAGRILIWAELDAHAAAMADAAQKQAETAIEAAPDGAALTATMQAIQANVAALLANQPQPPADMLVASQARFDAEPKIGTDVAQMKNTLSALGKAVA